jgi:hypothetical protein
MLPALTPSRYKIMSPHVEVRINSVAYDSAQLRLYVDISQTFSIWLIPFHTSHVSFITVLQLVAIRTGRSESRSSAVSLAEDRDADVKYLITSQDDLYQLDQWVRFIWFTGWFWIRSFQYFGMICSVLGAYLFGWVTVLEQGGWGDQLKCEQNVELATDTVIGQDEWTSRIDETVM